MKRLILIGLLLGSLLCLVGCTSDYKECFMDCRNYKYDCTFANAIDEVEGNCRDGMGFKKVNLLCYEECNIDTVVYKNGS